jgi:hypothetical protein
MKAAAIRPTAQLNQAMKPITMARKIIAFGDDLGD